MGMSKSDSPRGYTQADVITLTGIDRARFERWATAGLLAPTYGGGGQGRGVRRRFSLFDLVQLTVLKRLADQGLVRTEALAAVRAAFQCDVQQEASRWKAFKARQDKSTGFAAVMVRSGRDTPAVAMFVDSGAQVEEQFLRYEVIGDERVPIHGAIGAAWMVVEIGRLVAELERETGERLV